MGDKVSDDSAEESGAASAAGAAAETGRRARVRSFVQARPRSQRLAAVVAVALLLTAPFGGLEQAKTPEPDAAPVGKAFQIGPFDVTVEKAFTLGSLTGDEPEPDGKRFLVVRAVVSNPGTRPEYLSYLTEVLAVKHGGVVFEEGSRRAQALFVKDASSIGEMNPGLTYELALVFPQRAGWTRQDITLEIGGTNFVHEDPLTLDGDFWLPTDKTVATMTLPVEVKK